MKKSINAFWHSINMMSFIIMVVMIILVFINVILRYIFSGSIRATADVLGFLFVWSIMFGSCIAMRTDDHLNVRIIENFLSFSGITILRAIVNSIMFICSLLLVIGCFRAMMQNITNTSPLSGIPIGIKYMAGFFACSVMATLALWRVFKPLSMDDQENSE